MERKTNQNTGAPSWGNYLQQKNKDAKPEREETLRVSGMTCPNCEKKIEKAASGIEGVTLVKADFAASTVSIRFDHRLPNLDTVKSIIESLGYSLAPSGFSLPQLLGIAALIGVLFLLLSRSGLFAIIPEIDRNASYAVLLITGLLTSVHCVGMCGAINISQSVKQPASPPGKVIPGPSLRSRLIPGILYNGGRVISYTLIGAIVGAIGSVLSFSRPVQSVIVIVTGVMMVVVGLNILDLFPFLKKFQPRLPRAIGDRVGKLTGSRGSFVVGLLNGFMPCGPLQSMQLYALGTGSFLAGGLSMFFFSLGTVPLLLGVGAIGSLLSRKSAFRLVKVSAIFVFFLGIGMIVRGLNLGGAATQLVADDSGNAAVVRNGVQYVTTTLSSNEYEPITVFAGIPVVWTIDADASQINGCNNPVTVPSYDITKRLVPGPNTIEFTPRNRGTIPYTCWMGMITSTITVIDPLASSETTRTAADADFDPESIPTLPPDSPGGSDDSDIAEAIIRDGIQVIETDLGAGGYPLLVVQKGVPVRWNFRATEAALTGCNYRIMSSALGFRSELSAGDNFIEFTPGKAGTNEYTCWMRMIRGTIVVVDDIRDRDAVELAKNDLRRSASAGSGKTGGGCGGGGCCGGGARSSG